MIRQRTVSIYVGFFMILGIMALVYLGFQVSGLTTHDFSAKGYTISAEFNNIGQLKVRSPVKIAGVKVGEVTDIALDKETFVAKVTMFIKSSNNNIPDDSSLSILTEGLLGSNYIGVTPGYDEKVWHDGLAMGTENTHSALILENLISQFLFNVKKK